MPFVRSCHSSSLLRQPHCFLKTEPYLEEIQTTMLTVAAIGLSVIYSILDRGFEYGGVGVVIVILFNVAMLRNRILYFLCFRRLPG